MKTYDKTPRLTAKQAAYVKGIAELKSKRQAALDAGYAPSVARCARACIEGPGVRELFQTIARCWIDPELVGQRIAEGLNAMETKSAQFEGRFTDHINVIDWSAGPS